MGERNLREQGETNGFGQLEDKVMKTAAQFFGEDLLPYIGVKGKILTVAPTEHVHLEFESDSITEQDLRRFREYEAYIGMIYSAPVMTTVICTSNTKLQKKELINGDSVYRIEVVRLRDRNADKVFKKLRQKIHKGKRLRRRDIFPLLLTPLMSGDMEMSERIYQGMEFLQCEELQVSADERKRMQSVLYALAVKFLSRNELERIKERIGMTVLGKMLLEEGIEKGIEKGIEQGMEQGVKQGQGRVNALIVKLAEAGRMEDIVRAASDREYQDRLFSEFGL